MLTKGMTSKFRILDLHPDPNSPKELSVTGARTPEEAARLATGETLVRSGRRNDLRVRVYFQPEGQPTTMVRLYRRVGDRA